MRKGNKPLKVLLLFLSFLPLKIPASTFQEINPHRLITCVFSSHHQNRISVVGGQIKKIMHPEGNVHFLLEETSGQVFVYPLVSYPQNTTVSLVMEDGTVQDLELSFEKKSAELLVLNYSKREKCSVNEKVFSKEDSISDVVGDILSGRIPKKYISCPFTSTSQEVCRGIRVDLQGKLMGEGTTIYVFSVENLWKKSKNICEQTLTMPCTKWVYLSKRCLKRREKIIAVVCVDYE